LEQVFYTLNIILSENFKMKKSIIALIALSGFVALPAIAAGDLNTFRFECPNASGGSPTERLTNYGSYISGMGEENVDSNKTLPLFSGIPSAGVPLDLSKGGYGHAGTQYNPSTGRVTCLFTSTQGKDAFNVSYVADNIKNGWVVKADNSKITIKVLAG
jgi:hypothetical protein